MIDERIEKMAVTFMAAYLSNPELTITGNHRDFATWSISAALELARQIDKRNEQPRDPNQSYPFINR